MPARAPGRPAGLLLAAAVALCEGQRCASPGGREPGVALLQSQVAVQRVEVDQGGDQPLATAAPAAQPVASETAPPALAPPAATTAAPVAETAAPAAETAPSKANLSKAVASIKDEMKAMASELSDTREALDATKKELNAVKDGAPVEPEDPPPAPTEPPKAQAVLPEAKFYKLCMPNGQKTKMTGPFGEIQQTPREEMCRGWCNSGEAKAQDCEKYCACEDATKPALAACTGLAVGAACKFSVAPKAIARKLPNGRTLKTGWSKEFRSVCQQTSGGLACAPFQNEFPLGTCKDPAKRYKELLPAGAPCLKVSAAPSRSYDMKTKTSSSMNKKTYLLGKCVEKLDNPVSNRLVCSTE